MKNILITAFAAGMLVGCGESDHQHSHDDGHSHAEGDHDHVERDGHDHDKELKAAEPVVEASQPEPPTAKAPAISIHEAAFNGNIEAVKQHLAAGTDMNAEPVDPPFGTPFVLAVHSGHKEIVELLIAEGADVNAKNDNDGTPLHLASIRGHKEVAELLIAKGADVNAKAGISEKTPLHEAASSGHKEVVELLIANGADVNAKKKFGRTPLHGAATKGIAELLIAKGADVDGWSWEKAQRIRCVNNLKQIGIATRIYAIDNQDRFPWQVPQTEGGTAEIAQPQSDTDVLLDSDGEPIFDVNAWLHFQALSNALSNPKVLRCPRDDSRTQANSFSSNKPRGATGRNIIPFDQNSVSYWLRTDPEVDEARPNEVMVVCPHHDGQYNILLTDSSVQQASWNRLAQFFKVITNPITIAPQ